MTYSIIIPSKTPFNLAQSATSTLSNQFGRLIVVDDMDAPDSIEDTSPSVPEGEAKLGSSSLAATRTFDVVERRLDGSMIRRNRYPGEVVRGVKPFCFSRNVNLGIRAAGRADVILMNDDAQLLTAGGFDAMSIAANSEVGKQYGILTAKILGMAAAPEQCAGGARPDGGAKSDGRFWTVRHHMVAFICVYIRREVLDLLGWLDERFTGYGYEDDDFCRRVREAGLEIGVFEIALVEHERIPSTFRGAGRAAASDMLAENRRIFQQKWGTK